MPSTLDITKALADESRLRLLMLLRGGELCLCQLVEVLDLAPSTVSKHLALLHAAGLVQRRKDGKWHYYRLAGPVRDGGGAAVTEALRWVTGHMAGEPVVVEDARRLKRTLACDLEELCACYRN